MMFLAVFYAWGILELCVTSSLRRSNPHLTGVKLLPCIISYTGPKPSTHETSVCDTGNEAVWTTQPCAETGLLGMDLVRLGLERGATALAALRVIVDLMEQYGQGGNCAEHFAFNYHNSYLIADETEAWVLETAGRYWVAEKITSGTRSISNNLSIHGKGDLRHPELVATGPDFDFAHLFSGVEAGAALSPQSREGRVRQLCQHNESKFTVEIAKSILRDHTANVCMHGDFETRGSQVSAMGQGGHAHWFIESPFPCQQKYRLKVM